jgi:3-oxoacyl-[acyl-carrier protein] reductase
MPIALLFTPSFAMSGGKFTTTGFETRCKGFQDGAHNAPMAATALVDHRTRAGRMITYHLKGRNALVTGGASGIGLAAVTMLAKAGASVAMNHLPDDQMAEKALAALRDEGFDVIAAPGSVADADMAEAMVESAVSELGGLDFLISNAGTAATSEPIPPSELERMDEGFWQTILQTNLLGPFRCARAAAPALRASRGAIVSTASIAGLGTQGSSLAYAASKGALINMTRSLARGLGPEIRVNAVAPGHVDTPWTASWPAERKRKSREKAVLKRNCKPEDIAEVMLFLLAGAGMITGQTIVVDGGLTL